MTRLIVAVCIALALSLCMVAVSSAHKVNIFAYVDGETIVTDSGYSRSQRVHDGVVEVYDAASGKLLLSGNTDTDGKFSFTIPDEAREGKMDLRLLLKAGTGHQAEWTVRYSEFGTEEASAQPDEGEQEAVEETAPAIAAAAPAFDKGELESVVKKTVHAELAPVKSMLAELNQSGPGITEIIGGIGWILGLFGVAAYVKSRK